MDRPHPRGIGRPKEPVPIERLRDAARDAFAEKGYGATSVRDVAERAGVRKATIFYHFESKEGLYLDVMDRVVADLQGYVGRAIEADDHFVERLDRLGRLIVAYLGSHPGAARLLVREMVDGGPYAEGPGRDSIAATLARTAEFLAAGMRAGVFVEREPRQLALSIVGLHLLYFAVPRMAGAFTGGDIFGPEQLDARAQALLDHVRAMVQKPAT